MHYLTFVRSVKVFFRNRIHIMKQLNIKPLRFDEVIGIETWHALARKLNGIEPLAVSPLE